MAINLHFAEPDWERDVIIPDMDYVVVENTLGKSETRVETFNKLPLNVQSLVGRAGPAET